MTHPSDVVFTSHEATSSATDPKSWPATRADARDGGVAPGSLRIRQRRAWKTWQLVVAIVVALLVGMGIGNTGGSANPKPVTPGYKPPPPAGAAASATTTTTPATSPTTATGAATGAATGTTGNTGAATTAPPTTAAPPATATAEVLLPEKDAQGAWTSPPFTVGAAGWSIGWGYRCSGSATGSPLFEVFVVPTGSSPGASAAISETAASGTAVSTQSTTGSVELEVRAAASCAWAVKATGVA